MLMVVDDDEATEVQLAEALTADNRTVLRDLLNNSMRPTRAIAVVGD
jgi:hypothetical protein